MPRLNTVKDPKNGVISCWVCTGMMILLDVLRLALLGSHSKILGGIFLLLILIWIVISTVETIKYVKKKKNGGAGRQ